MSAMICKIKRHILGDGETYIVRFYPDMKDLCANKVYDVFECSEIIVDEGTFFVLSQKAEEEAAHE